MEQFLTDLAVNGHVSASTHNQALTALLFLDGQELGRLASIVVRPAIE
jgi:hypothetical protein